jgi:hypothetical protein
MLRPYATDLHADIAKILFPCNGHITIRFLEIRQHVGVNFVKVNWVAGIGSVDTENKTRMLVQTKASAPTKDKALEELHKILATDLVKKTTGMSIVETDL